MNKLSDEILKKKYDEIYNNFIKGDYLNVIKKCNYFLERSCCCMFIKKKIDTCLRSKKKSDYYGY